MVGLIDQDISIQDFRMVPGPNHTKLIFDAQVPYRCALKDQEISRRICSGIRALDGGFSAVVRIERGFV